MVLLIGSEYIVYLYLNCRLRSSYQGKIALMCLIPPYVFLSQTITLLSNVICSGLCMFYMSGKEVVECFVDIGIIVNHYCLDILYITTYKHALTLLQCCSYTVDITSHKKNTYRHYKLVHTLHTTQTNITNMNIHYKLVYTLHTNLYK